MRLVVIVDTSVFMNILDIPHFNQEVEGVRTRLADYIRRDANLLLPMTAIYEAGNHIAHIPNGQVRRNAAERFTDQVRLALDGSAPWRPTPFPLPTEMLAWLSEFPDRAMEGVGFGDLSIIKTWESMCQKASMSRILIWSLDQHLAAYDYRPSARR